MAQIKTYTVIHTTKKALDNHIAKIKARGGETKVFEGKTNYKLSYTFNETYRDYEAEAEKNLKKNHKYYTDAMVKKEVEVIKITEKHTKNIIVLKKAIASLPKSKQIQARKMVANEVKDDIFGETDYKELAKKVKQI